MQEESLYSKNHMKELGAFYSPQILSDFLAEETLSLIRIDKNMSINVVDPASGDGVLLNSISALARKRRISHKVIGIDVDPIAVQRSKNTFLTSNIDNDFINTDALYPLNCTTPAKGWETLKNEYIAGGIHIVVSNPPWGADISQYQDLPRDFKMASGQYDIYDLFIEMIITNLNEGGCYGIIVPDSIYSKEHTPIRKKILEETTVKRIVRLGEGFFKDVAMSVSIIFGIKKRGKRYNVCCSHLSTVERKGVLRGEIDIRDAIENSKAKIPVKLMIENNYSFITDLDKKDTSLYDMLTSCPHFGEFSESQRGVELSKKGVVVLCHNCGRWLPEPRWRKDKDSHCPHCGSTIEKTSQVRKIISNSIEGDKSPIIVGEDIFRYYTHPRNDIALGIDGINYKRPNLYVGSKILVRKTGVGITAGMDYNNCYINQVVYILRRKENLHPALSNEVLLAVLNSRPITYYFIKRYGNTGWKSHPYISQEMVSSLPFPNIDFTNQSKLELLSRITDLVRAGIEKGEESFPVEVDSEIEQIVAQLFGISKEMYGIIYETLYSVEPLIPFKRLLNINVEDIFQHGL